jgi:N6-adenosine-specific RNA methylase IME4
MKAARDERPIASITVGKRIRRDMGDIAGFASRIAKVGLIHPVVIKPDGLLVAGERRLEAYKHLGMSEVPVRVVEVDDIEAAEIAENTDRKDFLPSEIDAIRRRDEAKLKAAAKARMALGGRGKKGAKVSQPLRATDKIGAYAGVSGRTVEKIAAVVDAAEAEPEKFKHLLQQMDDTGRVNGVFKRLRVMKQAAQIRAEPPPLPGRGPYRVIVADPPWPYEIRREDPSHRATTPYPQMSIAQICALDVASIAAPNCVLWLWTTNYHMLNGAREVLEAWGFAPITILTWAKDRFGCGAWLRGQTEHCIFATRGKPLVQLTSESTLLHAAVREHSQKPDEFYALVERLCPAPRYAELFARRQRANWDGHGDEAPGAAGTTEPLGTALDLVAASDKAGSHG